MALANKTELIHAMELAAHQAGMVVLSAAETQGHNESETTSLQLALAADTTRQLKLELSSSYAFTKPELLPQMTEHLRESALRLRNPRPEAYVTLGGLPITLTEFQWPFHKSGSGADTFVVHGLARLDDGQQPPLQARLAASMTLTFAEIVPAPEQPFAESFIYNAIRKTIDQGQLEFTKSGNRQTVSVTTRYYSRWQKKFVFSDTTAVQRSNFVASKLYWMGSVQGGMDKNSAPVWIADPRDAQYMNTTVEELTATAMQLENDGYAKAHPEPELAGMWSATPKLLQRVEEFQAALQAALAFTRPTFNEEMRAGHTNM